jgi:predicted transcriptional regulator
MSRRDRKSKGTLSILDEFISESGAGEIIYSPKATADVMKRIEESTKLADIPVSSRLEKAEVKPKLSNKKDLHWALEKTSSNIAQTPAKALADREISSRSNLVAPDSPPIKGALSDNKGITNGYQTDNITQNKEITNRQQRDNKRITEISKKIKTDNKQVTKRITEQITNEQQTDNKQITIHSFESLVGNEKNLLLLIFKECLRIGSLISPEITLSHVHECLKISTGVAKVVIHRLVKKGFIKRETSKTGRGGWIKFSIQKELYQDLRIRESDNKEITNGYQTDNKQVTKQVTEQITTSPYSSSNLNINTNTIELPENLRRFGISTVNLQNLINSGKTTQEVVEQSLAALSFDVENGKTGNLANILFGVLGTGREYISQKYSETLQKELDAELVRIKSYEETNNRLQEAKLQMKFKEYLEQNPDFLESVRNRNKTFVNNPSVLEKLAFEEFKNIESKT